MNVLSRSGMLVILLACGPAGAQTVFRFPALDPDGRTFMAPVIGVDHDSLHDAADPVTCINYAGEPFPYCYNDHLGTDFLLAAGFTGMDQGVTVVAGAEGVVTEVVDGNYDRCHNAAGFQVSCDGFPMVANKVVLRHADGLVSSYWHLKKGSIKVRVGEAVHCGQALAEAGSSGKSAVPHLHFQLESATGAIIDPFAGPRSQALSYWIDQAGRSGHPGDLCAGEVRPDARAGSRELGPPDAGARRDRTSDAGAPAVVAGPVGCAMAPPLSGSTTPHVLLLALGLVGLVGRAARGRSRPVRAARR